MVKQYVQDLKVGTQVNSYFAVAKKESVKKFTNGFMFSVHVVDKTGGMTLKFWGGPNEDEVKNIFSSFKTKDIINVKGVVGEFKNSLEIGVNPGSGEIKKTDTYDLVEIVARTDKDIPQMIIELKNKAAEIRNEHIKQLVESFVNDEHFIRKFADSPAAKLLHHNYLGGLIEHVLNLIKMSYIMSENYPDLDRDILVAGCILHDIGKTVEYDLIPIIDLTDEGRLVGHVSIGYKMVSDQIAKISGFPEVLRLKILHIMLSHHRKLEHGSPITPKFPEAVAFALIDDCDGKTKISLQFKKKSNTDESWVWDDFNEEYVYLE